MAHQLHASYLDVRYPDSNLRLLSDLYAFCVLIIDPKILPVDMLQLELVRH
jgi:hypothetical protein